MLLQCDEDGSTVVGIWRKLSYVAQVGVRVKSMHSMKCTPVWALTWRCVALQEAKPGSKGLDVPLPS